MPKEIASTSNKRKSRLNNIKCADLCDSTLRVRLAKLRKNPGGEIHKELLQEKIKRLRKGSKKIMNPSNHSNHINIRIRNIQNYNRINTEKLIEKYKKELEKLEELEELEELEDNITKERSGKKDQGNSIFSQEHDINMNIDQNNLVVKPTESLMSIVENNTASTSSNILNNSELLTSMQLLEYLDKFTVYSEEDQCIQSILDDLDNDNNTYTNQNTAKPPSTTINTPKNEINLSTLYSDTRLVNN